jgi:prolyl-tRNA synthetase
VVESRAESWLCQLIFKPKTAKSAAPTPVFVIADESTSTPSGALGTLLNLKELRLAPEELIKEILPSAESKDDVSPLPLPTPIPSTLHLVLDSVLAGSEGVYAVHLGSSSSTILLKGVQIKEYLESLKGDGEGVKVVDFKELAGSQPTAPEKKEKKELAAWVCLWSNADDRPLGDAKPQTVKKEDDVYLMAIQYKKDEDFSGWYTDVSYLILHSN